MPPMRVLMSMPGVSIAKGHMCQSGMLIGTLEGKLPALKATGRLSNSRHTLETLAKLHAYTKAATYHKHVSLQNGRAALAAECPERLCYVILKGMRKQLLSDNVTLEGELGSVCEDPVDKQFTQSLGDCYFVDDVSGKLLNSNHVYAARLEEKI